MADTMDTTTDTDTGSDAGENTDEARTFSQDELDRIVGERLARERSKLGDVDELRRKAEALDRLEEERKTELEKAVDRAAKDAETRVRGELETTWRSRLVRSEVRAAAAGKLADPEDAVRFLALDELELDPDGNVDGSTIAAAVDKLLETKPYLAANGARREADFDAGARTPARDAESVNDRIRRSAGIRTS